MVKILNMADFEVKLTASYSYALPKSVEASLFKREVVKANARPKQTSSTLLSH